MSVTKASYFLSANGTRHFRSEDAKNLALRLLRCICIYIKCETAYSRTLAKRSMQPSTRCCALLETSALCSYPQFVGGCTLAVFSPASENDAASEQRLLQQKKPLRGQATPEDPLISMFREETIGWCCPMLAWFEVRSRGEFVPLVICDADFGGIMNVLFVLKERQGDDAARPSNRVSGSSSCKYLRPVALADIRIFVCAIPCI